MITLERVTEERRGGFVRHHAPYIGSLWCVDCADDKTRATGDWCSASNLRHGPEQTNSDPCDGCHRQIHLCTPLVVEGTAVVEHMAWKIF